MTISHHKQRNAQIYSEASDWLVEFRSGDIDPAGRKAFHIWLRSSPQHMRAYLELAAIWNEGACLDPHRRFDDAALMVDIRAQTNVVPAPVPRFLKVSKPSKTPTPTPALRRLSFSLAASLVLVLSGLGLWIHLHRDVYSTDVGEQRTVTLSDGSRIALNARSKVRIHFTSRQRSIELLHGQAFFRVAKDPQRPLVVTSDDTRVRAVGTQFDVYRKSSGTTVTVVEGRVAVASGPGTAAEATDPRQRIARQGQQLHLRPDELLLSAGEQAIVTARTTVKRIRPDATAATAWRVGRLVFQGTALREVAEEFNRYNASALIIRDPELAHFNITGVFSSTDPASLIRFLEARPGIVVTHTGDEIWVSREQ